MLLRGDAPIFFATDLTNFAGCRHLTALERLAAHHRAKRPHDDDPMLEVLRARGLAHEAAYVERLAAAGRRVVAIDRASPTALADTRAAMSDGADVIVQARLEHGAWAGWADVLLRVESSRGTGAHYEPVETKLAKETRGATLLQLCLYADLLAALQGAPPAYVRVVVPDTDYRTELYRFDEFRSYYRLLRRQFEAAMRAPLAPSVDRAEPYPDPVAQCDFCDWYPVCQARRVNDDHLSLVANIQRSQRKELATWGVTTLAGVGQLPLPLPRMPSRGSKAALERVREQARVQLASRVEGKPVYELLPIESGKGLAALPAPSPLDLFLDLEGDRLAENGGFDYLFGVAFRAEKDAGGAIEYEARWATTPSEEKAAFERFIDSVMERRRADRSMHVYHYAPYEPTAMKRLMGRYATRARELDVLLEEHVFVDLFSVVRKAIRAGVESYSIKTLEPYYGFVREVDLRTVSRHLRAVEYAIATRNGGALPADVRAAVRGYNRDDCVSTLRLRDWLEERRPEAESRFGAPVPRPSLREARVDAVLDARLAQMRAVAEALTAGMPLERDRAQDAKWVLAQLLEWHRREHNVDWWEFFRFAEMTPEDLVEERAGLGELTFVERIETTKRGRVVDRYRFPPQDTAIEGGDEVYAPGSEKRTKVADVEAIDPAHGIIDLKKPKAQAERHPAAIFLHETYPNEHAEAALLRLGEFVRDHGLESIDRHRAERDLLLRAAPRLANGPPLRDVGESTPEAACRAVVALDASVLAIQGPPGAGKTYTGARMILALVRKGRRVGVTAASHKVIRNLLDEVVRAAREEGSPIRCMDRVREKSEETHPDVDEEADSAKGLARIRAGEFAVVGGTAWVWCREEVADTIDVLVVDEAGQMSLANVLACAQAAKSLVLLGDPQQLEQPQKAAHPDGAELSALEHLLDGHDTIADDRGLFLGETWRLHPAICSYTSDLFYEGKLRAREGLEAQALSGPTRFAGAGLFYVPVVHDGNQSASREEAEEVAAIVAELTGPDVRWTDARGSTRPLTLADVLIVAPYNAQVAILAERVPGARVGTVDKFQGQEAAVVVYSMATSTPEEAPRGMDFLFSRHRLNVATSRARGACILVGNPRLFEPECRTPEQMRLANAFCAYVERATVIERRPEGYVSSAPVS